MRRHLDIQQNRHVVRAEIFAENLRPLNEIGVTHKHVIQAPTDASLSRLGKVREICVANRLRMQQAIGIGKPTQHHAHLRALLVGKARHPAVRFRLVNINVLDGTIEVAAQNNGNREFLF